MVDKKESNNSVLKYIQYANKGQGYINNLIVLKNQKIGIFENGRYIATYESDIEVNNDIPSGNYYLTIMDDLCGSYLHKCIFWATKYSFQFIGNKLIFEHENRGIELSC